MSLEAQIRQTEEALKETIEQSYRRTMNEVLGIKNATLWYRWTKDEKGRGFWDFNHLEDGHCTNPNPTPKCESHKQVWKGKWAKAHVILDRTNKVGHHLIY